MIPCLRCGHDGKDHNLTDGFPYTACALCECSQFMDKLEAPPHSYKDIDDSDKEKP